MVPNCFHPLGARATAARSPSAKVVGPASVRDPQLSLHMAFQDAGFRSATKELDVLPVEGCSFLDETVLFHRPTGSLIRADLVIRACPRDHFTWRWAARLTGCWETVRPPPDVKSATKPNDATARSIDRMAALPLTRILVAHADPIDDSPSDTLLEAWRFVRTP
ncbi:MAG: hypothetical protein J0L92_36910 [Deltaproteobacteria bacterium]|nr:hypothetical protein [Deltaproteobacteria bacterium]